MKVYIRANSDDPWTAERLVRLINKLSKYQSGIDMLFDNEENAIDANNKFAHGVELQTHRTVVFEIISQEDPTKSLDA